MALLTVVYWRDMPAQVIVKSGRKNAKRQLSERFEQAIDRAAMKSGAASSDAYLEDWRRADPVEVEGSDLEAIADAEAAKLEAAFDKDALRVLIEAGGHAEK
jgi:hypothetical protein